MNFENLLEIDRFLLYEEFLDFNFINTIALFRFDKRKKSLLLLVMEAMQTAYIAVSSPSRLDRPSKRVWAFAKETRPMNGTYGLQTGQD